MGDLERERDLENMRRALERSTAMLERQTEATERALPANQGLLQVNAEHASLVEVARSEIRKATETIERQCADVSALHAHVKRLELELANARGLIVTYQKRSAGEA